MQVLKHIRKYIEGELVNYPVNKHALLQIKQNAYFQQKLCDHDI